MPDKRCDRCGRGETETGTLFLIPKTYSASVRQLCSACVKKREWRRIFIFVPCIIAGIGFSAVIYAGMAADSQMAQHGLFFAILFAAMYGGFYALMSLHEAAHAVVGITLGMELQEVHFGVGLRILRITFRRTTLLFHLNPLGGHCKFRNTPVAHAPLKNALMVAAGPAVHILATLTLFIFLLRYWNTHDYFAICGLFVVFLIVNLYWLPANLTASAYIRNDQKLYSDMWQLRELWNTRDERRRSAALIQAVSTLTKLADIAEWTEVQRFARDCLSRAPATDRPTQSVLASWIAISDLWVDDAGDLDEAEILSRRSVSLLCYSGDAHIARAAVLMALAKDAEAQRCLQDARRLGTGIPFEKIAAHLWVELDRRGHQVRNRIFWKKRAGVLDPTSAYRIAWGRIGVVHFSDGSSLAKQS